jgi:hypothetical protein
MSSPDLQEFAAAHMQNLYARRSSNNTMVDFKNLKRVGVP